MIVYVCSYGGCASWTIVNHLRSKGIDAIHIHSNKAPSSKVNYTEEHFEYSKPLKENCKILFVYRNPCCSVHTSKACSETHMKNIGSEVTKLSYSNKESVLKNCDKIGYESFFDSYHNCNVNEDYDILSFHTDHFWSHSKDISDFLGVNIEEDMPEKKQQNNHTCSDYTHMFESLAKKIKSESGPKLIKRKS